MSNDQGPHPRVYQRILVDQANAEMGRRRISRRELSRISGIPRNTLDRLFTCERDMNVRQWEAIATALGFDPGELARKARADAGGADPMGQSGSDVRALITRYLDNPDEDPRLRALLDDVAGQSGVTVAEAKRLDAMIRGTRRAELEQALAALPPDNGMRRAQ